MLTIRLFRVGRKNQAAFKIVVTDKRNAASRGRFVEEVGFYNPLTKQRNLKGDRVKYWMSVGAQPSDTVYNMLITDGVIEGKKIPKHKLKKTPQDDSAVLEEKTETPTKDSSAEAPAKEEPNLSASKEEEKPAESKTKSTPEAVPEDATAETKPEPEKKESKKEEADQGSDAPLEDTKEEENKPEEEKK